MYNLAELKKRLESIEVNLVKNKLIFFNSFLNNDRKLEVYLSERLHKACRKGKVWKSNEFLSALKNAQYGFDPQNAISPGGKDGIFLLTRNHKPKNSMMIKIFDKFIDKSNSGVEKIAGFANTQIYDMYPVRLVSHHMRLLGLLKRGTNKDQLFLVDYDDSK